MLTSETELNDFKNRLTEHLKLVKHADDEELMYIKYEVEQELERRRRKYERDRKRKSQKS